MALAVRLTASGNGPFFNSLIWPAFSFTRVRPLPLALQFSGRDRNLSPMSTPQSTSFESPNCAGKYEVVRVEAPPGPTTDREITCLSCGGPLNGRQGPFLLKYFLIERPKRRASVR